MAYTAERPQRPDIDDLRTRIPGWGADLDPNDRPSMRLKYDPGATGAHWDFSRVTARELAARPFYRAQVPDAGIRDVGAATGLSGAIRRFAYRRYSEGRAAQWLLLIVADRVDAAESHLLSFGTLRPDNPITQTGIKAEFTHHGLRARMNSKRVDRYHAWIDPFIVAGPWLLPVVVAIRLARGESPLVVQQLVEHGQELLRPLRGERRLWPRTLYVEGDQR